MSCGAKTWGMFGDEEPCEHILGLRDFLINNGVSVYSEHGTNPDGWVNVHCYKCHKTYETTLRVIHDECGFCDQDCSGPDEDEDEDEDEV